MVDEDNQTGIDLRLSAQRALWGHVPPSLRAVSLEMRDTTIFFRAVFEPGAPDDDRELLSVAGTEIIADFSAPTTLEEEFLFVAPPTIPPHLRYLVFLRSEPVSDDDAG
jgi:hypothetical protein